MDTDERMHVALSPWDLTDDYNRYAGVTLISILDHCTRPVTVHLLYDERMCLGKEEETGYNKNCYQKIADKYDCILEYHHVEVPDWVTILPSVKKWTPGALLRLHLSELLPDIEKIIYFDCDMVINTSVDRLWETELHDTCLGACLDIDRRYFSRKRKRMYTLLGIPIKDYFCSGTLIFNLAKLRTDSSSFSRTIYQFLSDNPNLPYPDQDMLNWYCQGNYVHLSEKYNFYSKRPDYLEYCNDAVIHYAALKKPWEVYSGDIDLYYWKYAAELPWMENRYENIVTLLSVANIEKSLGYLEKNFVGYLNGTRMAKMKYALKFIGSIIISCIKGVRFS